MMPLPQWAVGAFLFVFVAVVGVAAWGFRYLSSRVHRDIDKLGEKIDSVAAEVIGVRERLVRVETIVNGQMTPPLGIPIRQPTKDG
jgi:hypothetical protein